MFLIALSCVCKMCPNCFPVIWSSLAWCASGYLSGMRSCINTCIQTARSSPNNVATEDSPLSETLLFPLLAPFSGTNPSPVAPTMLHPLRDAEGHHGTVMDPNMLERIPLFHTRVKYPNLESNYEVAKPVHTWRLSKGGSWWPRRNGHYILWPRGRPCQRPVQQSFALHFPTQPVPDPIIPR